MDFEENSADIVSPEYQQGFNEGYILATYEPEVSQAVSLAEGMTERLSGMKAGIEEARLEKEKLPIPKWMQKISTKEKTPGKEIEKDLDKGDFEKE